MKTNVLVIGLLSLCLVGAFGALTRCSTHLSAWRAFAEKIAPFKTFNDISNFVQDPANPRRFQFKPQPGRDATYLRFRITEADPDGWQLTMRIKARPFVLKHLVVRSAKEVMMKAGGVIEGDVATFTVNLAPKDTFMWRDGSCYVGVCPDKGAWLLTPGDVVELLDFKFSLR